MTLIWGLFFDAHSFVIECSPSFQYNYVYLSIQFSPLTKITVKRIVFLLSVYVYINMLRENLFSPLRSQIIVVYYDRLHVHCTSSTSSVSSISQHFSSPTDEFEDFLFKNGNRRRSKCIGDQSARSSSTRG